LLDVANPVAVGRIREIAGTARRQLLSSCSGQIISTDEIDFSAADFERLGGDKGIGCGQWLD
jgi:hypothetical protein